MSIQNVIVNPVPVTSGGRELESSVGTDAYRQAAVVQARSFDTFSMRPENIRVEFLQPGATRRAAPTTGDKR